MKNIVTISAFLSDYSEKAVKLHYANCSTFLPKSQIKVVEGELTAEPKSIYIELPTWLLQKNSEVIPFITIMG